MTVKKISKILTFILVLAMVLGTVAMAADGDSTETPTATTTYTITAGTLTNGSISLTLVGNDGKDTSLGSITATGGKIENIAKDSKVKVVFVPSPGYEFLGAKDGTEKIIKDGEVLTITEWRARRNSLDFDVCFGGWGPDYNDPMTDLDLMMSTNGNNHTGYASEEYDALIESTKTERDAAAREQIFVQAEMKLAEDMPVIPVYWRHEDYAASEKLVEGYARKPFQAYNFIYTKRAD